MPRPRTWGCLGLWGLPPPSLASTDRVPRAFALMARAFRSPQPFVGAMVGYGAAGTREGTSGGPSAGRGVRGEGRGRFRPRWQWWQRHPEAFVRLLPPPPPRAHLDAPGQRHGQQHVSGTAGPGVVKQDKSSRGSVDTTKTRSDPQRVRMSSGERPIGAAKGKQTHTMASCQPPPPSSSMVQRLGVCGGP